MSPDKKQEQLEHDALELVDKASGLEVAAGKTHSKVEKKKLQDQADELLQKAEEIIKDIKSDGETTDS